MARRRKRRSRGGAGDYVSAAFAVIAIVVSMVFLGYMVGNFAVRTVTKPLMEKTPGVSSQAAGEGRAPQERTTEAVSAQTESRSSSETAKVTSPVESPAPSAQRPLADPQPGVSADATAVPSSWWRVRVGSYVEKVEAEAALLEVRAVVPDAFVVRDDLYRIQVGAFGERSRAEAMAADLAKQGLAAEVVP